MSYPKAMLSQLTDLDDSELDEQAGVFSFTNKKGAPPSPKLFFNPASTFLDVPDYRETVSHSKRYTHQPGTPGLTNEDDMEDTDKKGALSKSKGKERRLSIETMENKENGIEGLTMLETKNKKTYKGKLDQKALSSNILSVKGSDSESYLDSDEQEEYMYNKPMKYKNGSQRKKKSQDHYEYELENPFYKHEEYSYSILEDENYKKKKNYGAVNHVQYTESEDETLAQVWNKRNPMNRYVRRQKSIYDISLFSILLLISLTSLFMAIYSLSTLPLVDVTLANISNILAAENELAFDIHVKATNWNIWSIHVSKCNLGIYVTPKVNQTLDVKDNAPVIYLGDIEHLQQPLVYPGYYLWQKRGIPVTLTSLVRLPDPGKFDDELNKTNSWNNIIKGPYDLTVRGSLSYTLFYQDILIGICASQLVDPTKNSKDNMSLYPTVSCLDDDQP